MDESSFPTIDLSYTGPSPGTGSGAVGSLADYLGCPPEVDGLTVSALPFRAYAMLWNEWYRDQDLETALTIDLSAGADTTTNTDLQSICWEKDYFTSSRPWTQKGPEVTISLTGDAPVTGIGKRNQTFAQTSQAVYETDGSGSTTYANAAEIDDSAANRQTLIEEDPNNAGYPNIRADLSGVTTADRDWETEPSVSYTA